MKCPFCHKKNLKVIDSREASEQNAIRRRRECIDCLRRFTTFETMDVSLQVHKRDGRFEDFSLQKLINGLLSACRHTTISHDRVISLASTIGQELFEKHERVITAMELGEIVMEKLQALDAIAYIRFACVYRRFKRVDEIRDALQFIENPCDGVKTCP